MSSWLAAKARRVLAARHTGRTAPSCLRCGRRADLPACRVRTGMDARGVRHRRHALSLLANGDLGWIQVANFLIAGVLVIAGAIGARRVQHAGRGGTWGPLLLSVYGLGLIGAGVFPADPGQGFPPGTPMGAATHQHRRADALRVRRHRVLRLDRRVLRLRAPLRRARAQHVGQRTRRSAASCSSWPLPPSHPARRHQRSSSGSTSPSHGSGSGTRRSIAG